MHSEQLHSAVGLARCPCATIVWPYRSPSLLFCELDAGKALDWAHYCSVQKDNRISELTVVNYFGRRRRWCFCCWLCVCIQYNSFNVVDGFVAWKRSVYRPRFCWAGFCISMFTRLTSETPTVFPVSLAQLLICFLVIFRLVTFSKLSWLPASFWAQ